MKHIKLLLLVLIVSVSIISCNGGGTKAETDNGSTFDENGASKAVFSVSPTKKVRISQGNLQYQASTGTWRFAEEQYGTIGEDNKNISETYDGWIDLFGWGTSGWNSGAKAYTPTASSTNPDDYLQSDTCMGKYANADWGVYNAISNGGNKKGMWRVMTTDEWCYLTWERAESIDHIACKNITIDGKYNGTIILPDDWTGPSDLKDTTYTMEQWKQLENLGAVFFPTTGIRNGTTITDLTETSSYWTTVYHLIDDVWRGECPQVNRSEGLAVRLVQDVK